MGVKVKLRKEKIKNGLFSLYLDFYPAVWIEKKKRFSRREFLGIYIHQKPKTPLQKKENKEKELLAEQIRLKRELELNKQEIYTELEKEEFQKKLKQSQSFFDFWNSFVSRKNEKTQASYKSAFVWVQRFTNDITFNQINEAFCNEFRDFLAKNIKQNTASLYFARFKAVLKEAFLQGFLNIDLAAKSKSVKKLEVYKEVLAEHEIQKLIETECNNETIKRAALFAIYTGLRFSDIQKLTWNEIKKNDSGYFIEYRQQKTKSIEYLPLNEQALQLIGIPKNLNDKVFEGINYNSYNNNILKEWVRAAGINKKITFHSFRHTFATLMILKGVDLFTVSKLLGHKDIKTTLVYAKIADSLKRSAVEKLNFDVSVFKSVQSV